MSLVWPARTPTTEVTDHQHVSPAAVHVPHWILRVCHRAAILLALLAVLALALAGRYGWLHHRPGGEAFTVGAQPWFMAAFAFGTVVALRFRLVGGAITVFTASALTVFALRQLRLPDAMIVFAAFAIPGLLWLLVGLFELRDERFHRGPGEEPVSMLRRRDVLGGSLTLVAAAVAGRVSATRIFEGLYGPTHPASTAAPVRGSITRWVWAGAVTPTSATVTTRLVDDDLEPVLRLRVGTTPDLADSVAFETALADEGLVMARLSDLVPGREYFYGLEADGVTDTTRRGRIRTPTTGPMSFRVAIGSCARTDSNGAVYDTIRALDPDLMIVHGDLHYADISRNDAGAFRRILDRTLSRPGLAALMQECPLVYVWDDHDFGGTDKTSMSKPAAMATYRSYAPHYGLAGEDSAIFQAFTIGRIRFVLTDARSARDPGSEPPRMLGARQKQWLKDELVASRDAHVLTVWVNPVPWISSGDPDRDDWSAFGDERAELADFIATNDLAPSLVMVCGDAHMVAIDDGTNSDYSASGNAAFPVLHAAALDRNGSVKGGPYSHGAFSGGGQFGLVEVEDDGARVKVRLSGRTWRGEVLVEHRLVVI